MLSDEIKEKLKTAASKIFFDEPMSQHTTIRVGGPADALIYPANIEELQNLLSIVIEHKLPIFHLGWGSNLVVQDGGIRGLVISLERGFQKLEIPEQTEADDITLLVEAGVKIPALLDFCAEKSLTGLEFMAGIPATVGGALWMNAGTSQGEIGDRVSSVTIITKQGRLKTLEQKACGFAYRTNNFPSGATIVETRLQLKRGQSEKIRETINSHRKYRVDSQPLNLPNVGSVFKNPSKKQYAGQLIEEAGLKDVRVGHARVSEKHGNFIVNEGNATAKDIIALIGLIKDKVKEKCNVRLETEVHIVGEKSCESLS